MLAEYQQSVNLSIFYALILRKNISSSIMKSTLLFLFLASSFLFAEKRPNILWITSEDNDKQWLGCYGNKQAHTPNLDALAKRAVRFENFFSNAPVCAVARSTILTGIYAPSQGSQHMRSRHPIPTANLPYVQYLREAGYYCTNASKTDFNFQINDKAIWDDCSGSAHFKNRPEGKPFFSIFNLLESHESSLFAEKIKTRRKSGEIPEEPRLNPAEVTVPPYLPDLPEVRSDIAIYHDNITNMDRRVGEILKELTDQGLAEDTIVFYYADHGGITPRGKRYLKDTGVNIPLLVHVPEKWQALSPFSNGTVSQKTVAFIDLAPTLLSLLDITKPAQMQGQAFLGKHLEQAPEDDYVFLFADRFDEIYGMRRGLTDGRWKYIRRFTPHQAAAPYSYFQFGQEAWTAWQEAWKRDKLSEEHQRIWEKNQATEELFDTSKDRWEVTNLATDPAYADQLKIMRKALREQMIAINDTGVIPEPMFSELAPKTPIATYVKSRSKDWSEMIELAFKATQRNEKNLPLLTQKLTSEDPLERYWAVQGCLILGEKSRPAEEAIRKLLTDKQPINRASAAQALVTLGSPEGAFELLLKELSDDRNHYAQQNVINVYSQLDALEKIPDSWVKKYRAQAKKGNRKNYVTRFANKLSAERGL